MLGVLHHEWERDTEQTAYLRALTTTDGEDPAPSGELITDEETMAQARAVVARAVGW